jgi:hypothetical protein
MTDAAECKQPLFWAAQQNRWICLPCNNTIHRHCEGHDCRCMCRGPFDDDEEKNGPEEEKSQ